MRKFLLPVATILLALAPSRAWAADPLTQEDEATLNRARALYDRSQAVYAKGDLEESRKLAEEVWNIKKHWQVAAHLAYVELKTNRYRSAAEHAAWSLRHYATDAPEERKATEGVYAEAKARVATVNLHGVEPDATVFVDDKPRDRLLLPDPVFLDPGSHSVEVRRADGSSKKRTVTAEPGKSVELDMTPDPIPKPTATATPSAMPATTAYTPTFETSSRGWTPRTWTLVAEGGLAVVAVGVGAAFGLRANSLHDDVQSAKAALPSPSTCLTPNPQCSNLITTMDDHDTAARWANVALVTGGVLGVATVATLLLWPNAHARSALGDKVSISPTAGNSTGLTLRGAF